jgi:hypothetical protein
VNGVGMGKVQIPFYLQMRCFLLNMSAVDDTHALNITCTLSEKLYFAGTNLEGTIPTTLGKLTKLRTLMFRSSTIHGSIPEEFSNLTNLREILIINCNIGGTVPKWISDLAYLGEYDLY